MDVKFFQLLFSFDQDLAEKARLTNCQFCGSKLHQGHFQRKPRGGPQDLDEECSLRFSFCCYECRKRLTPASLRFLGRRVYFGGIMVLISAMLWGASSRRLKKLHELCGADSRTLKRWRQWWAETFIQTDLWKTISPRLIFSLVRIGPLPRQLLRIWKKMPLEAALQNVLQLLLPLTGQGGG